MASRSPHRAAGGPRLSSAAGFTLIELLVVLLIIAILLSIAIPSLLGYRTKAQDSAAEANIRAALPAVATYRSDNGTYAGMSNATLRAIDAGLQLDPLVPARQTATSYCIASSVGTTTWRKNGPAVDTVIGTC